MSSQFHKLYFLGKDSWGKKKEKKKKNGMRNIEKEERKGLLWRRGGSHRHPNLGFPHLGDTCLSGSPSHAYLFLSCKCIY